MGHTKHPYEYMADVLNSLGIDQTDPNFHTTSNRFVKYLVEFMQPYDPASILKTFPKDSVASDSMVVQSNIPFRAVCAHHLLPFVGRAHVGYVPTTTGGVVGLSKLTRLVDCVSHATPSLQELIGERIVDDLNNNLEPLGAICVISAEHMCMACRGARALDVVTTTSAIRGVFMTKPEARAEFFKLVELAHTLRL